MSLSICVCTYFVILQFSWELKKGYNNLDTENYEFLFHGLMKYRHNDFTNYLSGGYFNKCRIVECFYMNLHQL